MATKNGILAVLAPIVFICASCMINVGYIQGVGKACDENIIQYDRLSNRYCTDS